MERQSLCRYRSVHTSPNVESVRVRVGQKILAASMRDDEFAAITSQQELDDYLARRRVRLNGRDYAYVVWKGYLAAKKRRRRAPRWRRSRSSGRQCA